MRCVPEEKSRGLEELQSEELQSVASERKKIFNELRLTQRALEEQTSKLDQLTREVVACRSQLSSNLLGNEPQEDRIVRKVAPPEYIDKQRRLVLKIRSFLAFFINELKTDENVKQYESLLAVLDHYLKRLDSSSTAKVDGTESLSLRELRVLSMITVGMTSEEIAEHLHISPDTVKTHRRNIRRKLHIVGKGNDLASYLQSSHGQEGSPGDMGEPSKPSNEDDSNSLKSEPSNAPAADGRERESSPPKNTFNLIRGLLAGGT